MLAFTPYLMSSTPPTAFAVIDGSLCELGPFGGRSVWHAPLATAIVEFRRGPLRTYVREHPYGLLPGMPNLYCLDGAHRLQWMAEWPDANDPCTAILEEIDDVLIVLASSGAIARIDAATGRLLTWIAKVAAAG